MMTYPTSPAPADSPTESVKPRRPASGLATVHPNQRVLQYNRLHGARCLLLDTKGQSSRWNAQETPFQQVQQAAVHSPSFNRIKRTKFPYVPPPQLVHFDDIWTRRDAY